MELKEYLKILIKHFKIILFSAILLSLSAFIFTINKPVYYQAIGSMTITPKSSAELKNIYQYDGYYALQASNLFGITISSWLANPDIVTEIYKKAGYSTEGMSTQALSKTIKTSQNLNSSLITFQLNDLDKEKVRKLALAVIELVKEKTALINKDSNSKINFEIVSNEPLVNRIDPKKIFNTAVGFLIGLFLGGFLAFVIEYFSNEKS